MQGVSANASQDSPAKAMNCMKKNIGTVLFGTNVSWKQMCHSNDAVFCNGGKAAAACLLFLPRDAGLLT